MKKLLGITLSALSLSVFAVEDIKNKKPTEDVCSVNINYAGHNYNAGSFGHYSSFKDYEAIAYAKSIKPGLNVVGRNITEIDTVKNGIEGKVKCSIVNNKKSFSIIVTEYVLNNMEKINSFNSLFSIPQQSVRESSYDFIDNGKEVIREFNGKPITFIVN